MKKSIQCSTQYIDHVQGAVAQILAVPNKSYINVKVDQLGGGMFEHETF
jgi:xanthine dehydrogenase molybdopterin-binding subunit B